MSSIKLFMNKRVVTAAVDETVAAVARKMRDASIGAVVVVEDKRLAGIFSERDLLTRVVADGLDPATTPVGEVATREVVSVEASEPLKACAEKLKQHQIRHLPVLQDGVVTGIVGARDFFEAAATNFEDLIGRLQLDQQLSDNVDPYDHLGGSYGR